MNNANDILNAVKSKSHVNKPAAIPGQGMKYEKDFIKKMIDKSNAWTIRAVMAIVETETVKKEDSAIFETVVDYHNKYGKLTDRHVNIVRKKIRSRYLDTLYDLAN